MAEDIRQLSDFNRIVLRDWGKLVLTRGEARSVIVEADDEFLSEVSTVVEDRTLVLRVGRKWLDVIKNTLNTSLQRQKVSYYVTVPSLDGLEVTGAARVKAEGLSGEEFVLRFGGAGEITCSDLSFSLLDVEMPGAGKLEVSGTVDEQHVMLSGAGSYDASALACQRATVELRGVGKARVHVDERLKAMIRGLGSIEYSGEAEVEKIVNGLGQVTRV